MKWTEFAINRKGFLHHADTPKEDREFYFHQKEKATQLLQLGSCFLNNSAPQNAMEQTSRKVEYSQKSRYLHRGFYCPSLVLDIVISNAKRGEILNKSNRRNGISNRYEYDAEDRLVRAENFSNGKRTSTEYIFYRENYIYGVTVDNDGIISIISEEEYAENHLQSFILAHYSENGCCRQMDCEKYDYSKAGGLIWDYYQLHFGWERVAPSGFVAHDRYRFTEENGILKDFALIDEHGGTINPDGATVIDICRKVKI